MAFFGYGMRGEGARGMEGGRWRGGGRMNRVSLRGTGVQGHGCSGSVRYKSWGGVFGLENWKA